MALHPCGPWPGRAKAWAPPGIRDLPCHKYPTRPALPGATSRGFPAAILVAIVAAIVAEGAHELS